MTFDLVSRLWGEPVNLREQHDALEFFNSLVDSLDEALKSLGYTAILSKVMGGSFADQKICKDCPHRFVSQECVCRSMCVCADLPTVTVSPYYFPLKQIIDRFTVT